MIERKISRRNLLIAGLATAVGLATHDKEAGKTVTVLTRVIEKDIYDCCLADEYPLQDLVREKAQIFPEDGGIISRRDDTDQFVDLLPQEETKQEETKIEKRVAKPQWGRETLLTPLFKGPGDRPLVALTIDDGFYKLGEILQTLKDKGVGATFFIIGRQMEQNADFIKKAAEYELGEFGNHTYTHGDLTRKTTDQIRWEIETTEAVLANIVGGATTVPYLRPFGGNKNNLSIAVAADQGDRTILWNVSGDAGSYTPRQLVDLYLGQLSRMSNPWGSIILTHFLPATALALPDIIDGIRVLGMEPVSLSKLFASSS